MNTNRINLKSQRGFTLLELVITAVIICVLGAIAIPQYLRYKALSRDQEANVILRRILTAEEAYFVSNAAYRSCDQTDCSLVFPELGLIPPTVTVQFTSTGPTCSGTAKHNYGTGRTFSWSS